MLESYSFLSQAREPWITFSKVFAIQYDACHGRLNPCGGRLHSLRPVVSRLCFFSLHLISHPKFQSSTHFFFLPWSVYFLFIWFSNPNFQSFTHFLFELNFNFFLPWSAAGDEPSFALSVLKKSISPERRSCGTFSTWERLKKKVWSLSKRKRGIEPCVRSWYLCSSPELKFVVGNCQIEAPC